MCKVSIIIATYHRPDLLKRAVFSAINQTYEDIEIIVVDDNPVNTVDRNKTNVVMRDIINAYPQVKYIQNENNSGGAVTRNNGIKVATGEYIAFLDDDDEYLPRRIEIQLREMRKHDWDVSVMDGATYDEAGNLLAEKKQHIENGMTRDELIRMHVLYHISGTNTFMFKADKLKSIGGFDNTPACHEYILMQKAIEAGFSIGYVQKSLVKNHANKGERLSTSIKKIVSQKLLIEKKQKYFNLLSKKEKNAVLCRHYGVLFNVYYKNKHYLSALINLMRCVLASPKDAYQWYEEYKNKIGV